MMNKRFFICAATSSLIFGSGCSYTGDLQANGRLISVKSFGARGDGLENDGPAIQAALLAVAGTGQVLYFPPGDYCAYSVAEGPVIKGVSHTDVVFSAGAKISLKKIGNHNATCLLDNIKTEKIRYRNIRLDCNGVEGANAFGVSGSSDIRLDGAEIENARRSPKTGGGRGFTVQFACNGIYASDLVIRNCTSGIDFHGRKEKSIVGIFVRSSLVSNCEEAISFYDLYDPIDDLPVGVENQVIISDVSILNCGKSTKNLLDASFYGESAEAGAVIVSERAKGFFISNIVVVNDKKYGRAGALFRGSASNFLVSNVLVSGEFASLFDFRAADNLLPVRKKISGFLSGVNMKDVFFNGGCDHLLRGRSSDGASGVNIFASIIMEKKPRRSLVVDEQGFSSGSILDVVVKEDGFSYRGDVRKLSVSFPYNK